MAQTSLIVDRKAEVLLIPELLEHILSFLSTRDLFRAERVNRRFRDVIRGSTILKEKLWLAPNKVQEPRRGRPPSHAVIPLRCSGMSISYVASQNDDVSKEVRETLDQSKALGTLTITITSCEMSPILSGRDSLKQMSITQPPITQMSTRTNIFRFGRLRSIGSMSRPEGLRVCDLLNEATWPGERVCIASENKHNTHGFCRTMECQATVLVPFAEQGENSSSSTINGKQIWYEMCLTKNYLRETDAEQV